MHFGEYELSPGFDWPSIPDLTSIRKLFKRLPVFGLPESVNCLQTCTRGRITRFASSAADSGRNIRLAFAFGSTSETLSLAATKTRRFIMQKARRHRTKLLRPLVGSMICRVFFTSLCSRFFSPFPHGLGSLSVSPVSICLTGWSRFGQNFSCSGLTQVPS